MSAHRNHWLYLYVVPLLSVVILAFAAVTISAPEKPGTYMREALTDPHILVPVVLAMYILLRMSRMAKYYDARGEAEAEGRQILGALEVLDADHKRELRKLSEKLDALEKVVAKK